MMTARKQTSPEGGGTERAMNPRDLIKTARGMAVLDPQQPTQADLRRAISTAYYALFHCLALSGADLLIGAERDSAWHQVYRALEHGKTGQICDNDQKMAEFPESIRKFATAFVMLQRERQQADYALEVRYNKSFVLEEIDRAEKAISHYERAGVQDRRRFVALVLFKQRSIERERGKK